MIEITDIVNTLSFGFENHMGTHSIIEYPIDILSYEDVSKNNGNYKGNEEILDWMKYFWKPSLHFERGLCYTFDGVAITLNQTNNNVIATMARKRAAKIKVLY